MQTDAIRLNALIQLLRHVSRCYAKAGMAARGTAYGVELRTLAKARSDLAERFVHRLDALGAAPRELPGPGEVDVAALVADPRTGVSEVLRAERVVAEDLADSSRDDALTPETRQLAQSALPHVRAHARRVEAFLETL
jgi:hypothetical protein